MANGGLPARGAISVGRKRIYMLRGFWVVGSVYRMRKVKECAVKRAKVTVDEARPGKEGG